MTPPVQQEYIITASQLEEMWTQCESRYFDEMRDAIRSRPAPAAPAELIEQIHLLNVLVETLRERIGVLSEIKELALKLAELNEHQSPASPDNILRLTQDGAIWFDPTKPELMKSLIMKGVEVQMPIEPLRQSQQQGGDSR